MSFDWYREIGTVATLTLSAGNSEGYAVVRLSFSASHPHIPPLYFRVDVAAPPHCGEPSIARLCMRLLPAVTFPSHPIARRVFESDLRRELCDALRIPLRRISVVSVDTIERVVCIDLLPDDTITILNAAIPLPNENDNDTELRLPIVTAERLQRQIVSSPATAAPTPSTPITPIRNAGNLITPFIDETFMNGEGCKIVKLSAIERLAAAFTATGTVSGGGGSGSAGLSVPEASWIDRPPPPPTPGPATPSADGQPSTAAPSQTDSANATATPTTASKVRFRRVFSLQATHLCLGWVVRSQCDGSWYAFLFDATCESVSYSFMITAIVLSTSMLYFFSDRFGLRSSVLPNDPTAARAETLGPGQTSDYQRVNRFYQPTSYSQSDTTSAGVTMPF